VARTVWAVLKDRIAMRKPLEICGGRARPSPMGSSRLVSSSTQPPKPGVVRSTSMSTSARRLHYYADYLRALAESSLKLEYCDGAIFALVAGTPAHARLAAAMIVALHRTLPRECRISTSDLEVRVESTVSTHFPENV
jgi:hypothetical protein